MVTISSRYAKGDYSKTVEVETNDQDTPVLKLTIKVKVQEVLSIEPIDINFGTVKTGSVNMRMITMANKGKEPLKITGITANPSTMLSVSHKGKLSIDPGKSISVELRFQAGSPNNFFFGTVHVETDDEKIKFKDIRIRAKILGS